MKYRRQSQTFQIEENPFAKNAEGIGRFFTEVSLSMNFYRLSLRLKI